ncbi:MAG: type II toxin-antitoxin system RelE/ParE family toxin [Candidatus Woesearchaeota archaeon]|jgi:mRNA-degrading endonuclease RelE of RelBE toxin-antitoxin system
MYKIYLADEFERSFNKLDNSIQEQIDKEIEQLVTNPYVGKPLGYSFFREKKIRNYRIYYLIYEEEIVVFLISVSNKKDQQKSIDKIKALIPIYKEEIQKRLNL